MNDKIRNIANLYLKKPLRKYYYFWFAWFIILLDLQLTIATTYYKNETCERVFKYCKLLMRAELLGLWHDIGSHNCKRVSQSHSPAGKAWDCWLSCDIFCQNSGDSYEEGAGWLTFGYSNKGGNRSKSKVERRKSLARVIWLNEANVAIWW